MPNIFLYILLSNIDLLRNILALIGVVFTFLIGIGLVIATIWWGFWKKNEEEEKESTENLRKWLADARSRLKEVEDELNKVKKEREEVKVERDALRDRVREVESNYIELAEICQKQQGQIENLTIKIDNALSIKTMLAEISNQLKKDNY